MRKIVLCSILIGLGLTLAACQSIQDITDAMEGRTPDADSNGLGPTKGPPLTMPPDYSLRPPLAGAGASDNRAAAQAARSRTFSLPSSGGGGAATPASATSGPVPAEGPSAGEKAFVRRLQSTTGPVDPAVRSSVGNETQAIGEKDDKFVDKLLTWKDAPPPAGASAQPGQTVVEKPANDSPQVVIQRKRGLLDSLF